MTQKISVLTLSLAAASALTAERFIGADGNVAAAAGNAVGVNTTDAAAGDQVAYDALGTTVVTAGGAIASGAAVEVGAGGKAVTKAAGITVARVVPGSSATADGDRIEVFLIPN